MLRELAVGVLGVLLLVGLGIALALPVSQPSKESITVSWKPEHGEMVLEAIGKTDLIFAKPPVDNWIELKYDLSVPLADQYLQVEKLLNAPGVRAIYHDTECPSFRVNYTPDRDGTVMTILCRHSKAPTKRHSETELEYAGPLSAILQAELHAHPLVKSVDIWLEEKK
jgi:hypothetical protein